MISIKFKTQQGRSKVLKDSGIRDESTKDVEEETDFVTSVDSKQIHGSKKKVEKKELVIPLISKNNWNVRELRPEDIEGITSSPTREDVKPEAPRPPPPKMTLEEQAIQELMLGQQSSSVPPDDNDDVPLLLQNKPPKGFEEDDNMDVSLRPDQSTLEDYERVPIDEYGLALLRGMGFKKGEGIGLTNKKHVEMTEPQLRPKGLGLGATISLQVQKGIQNSQVNNKEDEELYFKIGAGALIKRGPDKGMYGRIQAFDEDNNRVVLKLAINGKHSDVSKFHIDLVKESEYKGKSKILNYNQYSEYKEKHDAKDSERRSNQAVERKREADEEKSHRNSRHNDDRDSKKTKRDSSNQNGSSSKSYSDSKLSSRRNWVRTHLKVRFIDEKYKKGKYFEKKFIVEDVIEMDRFVLRSESGETLLEDIKSSQVETVIPRAAQSAVLILSGRYKGKIGELVDKNRRAETAIIKIPDGAVCELSFDDICEFAGDPEDYF